MRQIYREGGEAGGKGRDLSGAEERRIREVLLS